MNNGNVLIIYIFKYIVLSVLSFGRCSPYLYGKTVNKFQQQIRDAYMHTTKSDVITSHKWKQHNKNLKMNINALNYMFKLCMNKVKIVDYYI